MEEKINLEGEVNFSPEQEEELRKKLKRLKSKIESGLGKKISWDLLLDVVTFSTKQFTNNIIREFIRRKVKEAS